MKGMTLVKKSTCGYLLLIAVFVLFGIYAIRSEEHTSELQSRI